jgi:hypothetical protein
VYRQRALEVTLAELRAVKEKAGKAVRHAGGKARQAGWEA